MGNFRSNKNLKKCEKRNSLNSKISLGIFLEKWWEKKKEKKKRGTIEPPVCLLIDTYVACVFQQRSY